MSNKFKKNVFFITLVSAVLLQAPAFAQDDIHNAQQNTNDSQGAQPSSNIPMVSGGVGEEIDYLRSVQNQYNLKLLFTEMNGMYLAEVNVLIKDKQGNTIVNTVTNGPILLVKLPAGSYKVVASENNVSREQNVTVTPQSLHSYQVRFPTTDSDN